MREKQLPEWVTKKNVPGRMSTAGRPLGHVLPEWVTKKNYAEHLSVSERTVERWDKAGLIHPIRLGLGKRPIKRYNKHALPMNRDNMLTQLVREWVMSDEQEDV
jgi:hypothetical protein